MTAPSAPCWSIGSGKRARWATSWQCSRRSRAPPRRSRGCAPLRPAKALLPPVQRHIAPTPP
eukprot:5809329-Alexandrium_andersonii.AAC.1